MAKDKTPAKSSVSKPRAAKAKPVPPGAASHDAEIRARAYALWEKAGKPHGADEHHWHAARQEIERERASK